MASIWRISGDYYLRYAKMYPYPMGSYGTMFVQWIHKANRGQMQPYNSCGNGSAMRIAPVGWAFEKEEDLLKAAKKSTVFSPLQSVYLYKIKKFVCN